MSEKFAAVEIISAKRDKIELSDDQIDWAVDAYTRGVIADEQMSALLMAILLNGMNNREISRWTDAMVASGEKMNWSMLDRPTVDKHSTGGVGDKITLPLAPLVAACGAAVPQLSGRGLGHTGGTLDKLESINGWKANLSSDQMLKVLQSSIMSKKIAEGTSALVLDVKTGSGAFISDPKNATLLAKTMVDLGKRAGVKTTALVTAMDVPLGLTVGNSLEIRETLEVLAGGGPSDVVELTLILANEMLAAVGIKPKVSPEQALKNGMAMDVWRKMISAQGGDNNAPLPVAKEKLEITASTSGKLLTLDAMKVGLAAWRLGAGRQKQGEVLQLGAGVEIHVKPGDTVKSGQSILTLHTDDSTRFARAQEVLTGAYSIGGSDDIVKRLPLVIERIEG